jgi:hypothetical protein
MIEVPVSLPHHAPRRRDGAYIWTTWLSPLLAGDATCAWAVWFKAHYTYTKLSTFDASAWQAEHQPLLLATRNALEADDFTVLTENQNKFVLRSGEITLAGKPDLVAVRGSRILVVDCKSGTARPAYRAQILTYMAALPYTHPEWKECEVEGLLQYRDGAATVGASELNTTFRSLLHSTVHLVGGPEAPPRRPSIIECRFCDISHADCPEREEDLPDTVVSGHDLF